MAEALNDHHPWQPPQVEGRLSTEPLSSPPTAESLEQLQAAAREEGYQEGFTKGVNDGLTAGREVAAQEVKYLAQIISHLADPLAICDEAIETTLGGLVVLIARHLVRRELKSAPDEIVAVVRDAVKALPAGTDLHPHVRVNPEDAVLLGELMATHDSALSWKLEADPMIERGGCVVETPHSYIDATVEAKINAVASQMLGGARSDDEKTQSDESDP